MDDRELLEEAKKAMEFAYAPYSNFCVGAALLSAGGVVYTGCNVENAAYGATNCAERTAFFKAVSQGERRFEKIAIASSGKGLTFPCGTCRQVMWEFMPQGSVILENAQGEICRYTVKELLPNGFEL